MKTIEKYELTSTEDLKSMIKKYEILNEDAIINLDDEKTTDYEIDISLIRMELTKRMWFNKK